MSEDLTPEPTPDPLDGAIDAAWAETVAHLEDLRSVGEEAVAANVHVKQDADEDEDEDDVCAYVWEPDNQAFLRATEHMERITLALNCREEREQGLDCDHIVAGGTCPFPDEISAHTDGCVRCTVGVVMADVWPFAVAEESASVIRHLMVLRANAQGDEDEAGERALTLAIENISAALHRG